MKRKPVAIDTTALAALPVRLAEYRSLRIIQVGCGGTGSHLARMTAAVAAVLRDRGEEVELKPVRVHVGSAELLGLDGDIARVRFACSRGTYIRALARDLGRALGVGAHLVSLRRTRSGVSDLSRAVRLDDLTEESLGASLVPMAAALETWPRVLAGPVRTGEETPLKLIV